jgi:hypothetical protein
VTDNLSRLQVGFKRELIKEVKLFVVDAVSFRGDWETNGQGRTLVHFSAQPEPFLTPTYPLQTP